MTIKDDIAKHLPDPPPPNPMRRDAAIEAAMQRFDGKPASTAQGKPSARWSWLRGPQLGLAVSAALVAVIGLPTIWTMIDQPAEAPQPVRQANVAVDAAPAGKAAFESETQQQAERALPPAAVAPEPSRDQAVEAPSEGAAESRPVPSPQPAAPEAMAESAKLARNEVAAPVVAAPAPPPPPPAIIAQAQRAASAARMADADSAAGEIIVTSARRSSRRASAPSRGDWNACTLDDPAQDLDKCRRETGLRARATEGSADAYLASGLQQAWAGRYDNAIADFDRAIAIAPKSSLAYLNRGLAYQRIGRPDQAKESLDMAIKAAPGSARAYHQRSLLLRSRGDFRRAEADEEKARALDPDYDILVQ